MLGFWNGVRAGARAGVRDARWAVYFAVLLPFALLPAVLLASVIEGKLPTTQSPLTWALTGLGALCAVYCAGIWDGPAGRLGRWVWALTLLFVVVLLIRALGREAERQRDAQLTLQRKKRVKLAGHTVVLTLDLTPEEEEAPIRDVCIPRQISRQLCRRSGNCANGDVWVAAPRTGAFRLIGCRS